MKSRFQP